MKKTYNKQDKPAEKTYDGEVMTGWCLAPALISPLHRLLVSSQLQLFTLQLWKDSVPERHLIIAHSSLTLLWIYWTFSDSACTWPDLTDHPGKPDPTFYLTTRFTALWATSCSLNKQSLTTVRAALGSCFWNPDSTFWPPWTPLAPCFPCFSRTSWSWPPWQLWTASLWPLPDCSGWRLPSGTTGQQMPATRPDHETVCCFCYCLLNKWTQLNHSLCCCWIFKRGFIREREF